MPKLLLVIPLAVAFLFLILLKNYGKDKLKKSIIAFAFAFAIMFVAWLFIPSLLFNNEQEKYVSELLNKTGLPPTIAKILASILAVIYVTVIWLGKWEIKPMNIVYAIAFPPILFLLLQFLYPNISKGCKAINPSTGKYEFCECDYADKIHPIWGTPVIKNDGVLTPINADEKTVLFDKNGKALFFYTEDQSGKISLFDQEGYTPKGDKTKSITPEIAKKYLEQIKAKPVTQINYQPDSESQKQKQESNNPPLNLPNSTIHDRAVQAKSQPLNTANQVASPPVSYNIISDYLIVSQSSNKIDGLLREIQNAVELKGNSSKISNNQNTTVESVMGKYKRMLTINGSLNTKNSSIDPNTLSTIYIYTIKIYNVETVALINSVSDKVTVLGFSEFENFEKVKQSVSQKIKSLL